ncbi:MAG: hypothetical protein ABJH98_18575 [Reichenbachiella sp.]|uniref:hypothetical protein n=1 Tax=Reichenbachiella sp. TaxID=2184521 RepID=UPI0032969537
MVSLKYIFFLVLIGCLAKPEKVDVYSIISKANCKGPSRVYHTELHATVDGYTRFHQSYPSSDPDYDAVIYGDSLGFTLAGDTIERWTESKEISVGKSHSFHMIAYNPKLIFNFIDGQYLDTAGNEVFFTFDKKSKQVQSFLITNPYDTEESIQIIFTKWEDINGIDLPMQVHIIQGEKDEYFFEFYEVKINDDLLIKIPAS